MDAEVESVMASSQDQREEELQVNINQSPILVQYFSGTGPGRTKSSPTSTLEGFFFSCLAYLSKRITSHLIDHFRYIKIQLGSEA